MGKVTDKGFLTPGCGIPLGGLSVNFVRKSDNESEEIPPAASGTSTEKPFNLKETADRLARDTVEALRKAQEVGQGFNAPSPQAINAGPVSRAAAAGAQRVGIERAPATVEGAVSKDFPTEDAFGSAEQPPTHAGSAAAPAAIQGPPAESGGGRTA